MELTGFARAMALRLPGFIERDNWFVGCSQRSTGYPASISFLRSAKVKPFPAGTFGLKSASWLNTSASYPRHRAHALRPDGTSRAGALELLLGTKFVRR